MAKNNQSNANLRVCASCEWIFKKSDHNGSVHCPKCKFGSYGAKYVYGNSAYRFSINQYPWKSKKENDFEFELMKEILKSNPIKKKTNWFI